MIAQGLPGAVFADLAELRLSGPRARVATVAALSVGLGTVLAIWLRLDAPYWAALSAFVCTQATRPASLTKAAERVAGTLLSAGTVFLLTPWLAQYPLSTLPALFVASTLGILGASLTRHSYAWLLGGITANMVIMGVIADPTQGDVIVLTRCVEIILGSAAALCVALLLAPPGPAAEVPAAPGFSTMFGPNRHVLGYALRTGIAVMLVPMVWDWFGIPGLSQMGISVAAVMAVPGLAANPEQAETLMRQRALHRIAGCVLGGVAGLAILALGLDALLPWLAARDRRRVDRRISTKQHATGRLCRPAGDIRVHPDAGAGLGTAVEPGTRRGAAGRHSAGREPVAGRFRRVAGSSADAEPVNGFAAQPSAVTACFRRQWSVNCPCRGGVRCRSQQEIRAWATGSLSSAPPERWVARC